MAAFSEPPKQEEDGRDPWCDDGHPLAAARRYALHAAVATVSLLLVVAFLTLRSEHRAFVRRVDERLAVMDAELERMRAALAGARKVKANKEAFAARWQQGALFSKAISLAHSGGEARGLAWVDYDADGDLDVLLCSGETNHLYRNTDGMYIDVTESVGLTGGSRCASWADFDGDGDMDLFCSSGVLWRNDGEQFVESQKLLPEYPFSNTEGAGWLDANADGMPDLMVTDGNSGIHLMLNRGGGEPWFLDVDDEWGLGRGGIGVGNGDFLSLADYDGDGFVDFLHNLGKGVLGRNVGGRGYEQAENANVAYASESPWKFGTAFGDWDNDGDLDLFVPQNGRPLLYQNQGNGSFLDVTRETGELAAAGRDAQSVAWGDINGDGFIDLAIGYGRAPLRVFVNEATGEMADTSLAAGTHLYPCATTVTGMAMADHDGDGDLDLLVTGERTESGILVNDWPRLEGWRSLRVRLPNTEAPGAVVRVYDEDRRMRGMRQLGLVQTFSAQGPWEALFAVEEGDYEAVVRRTTGEEVSRAVTVGDKDVLVAFDLPVAEAFALSAEAVAAQEAADREGVQKAEEKEEPAMREDGPETTGETMATPQDAPGGEGDVGL